MFMGKGTLSESHPNFIGVYNGRILAVDVREYVEGSDLVLSLGTVMSDINTGAFTTNIDRSRDVRIQPNKVIIGQATYHQVYMEDVLNALVDAVDEQTRAIPFRPAGLGEPKGEAGEPITPDYMYPRLEQFFRPGDIIMAETGTASMGLVTAKLPENAVFFNQTLWGAIGWATPAAIRRGHGKPRRADRPDHRRRLPPAHGPEISQFGRFGLKPVVICLNNNGYLIERMLCEDPYIYYNDLAQWNYHKLPDAFGMEDWECFRAATNGELDAALTRAGEADSGVYIEIVTDTMAASDMALALNRLVFQAGGWKS